MELLNCLPGRRVVFVRVGEDLVELRRGPSAFVAGLTELDASALEVTTPLGTTVLSAGQAAAVHLALLPAPRDGVLLLVEPETLVRLPLRADLVAPASFAHPTQTDRTLHGGHPSILSGVHRSFAAAQPAPA